MLERTAEKYLKNWYRKNHRKPLMLRGARQVGKSTLVRHFAEKNGLVLNEVNLEQIYMVEELPWILDELRSGKGDKNGKDEPDLDSNM